MKFRCAVQIFLFSWIIFVLCGCTSLQKKKYRLVPGEQTSVLVPPGISVSKQSRIVSFHSHQSNKACDPGVGLLPVKKKKLHLRVSVTRQQLERLEPGSLNTLGIHLLEKECLVGGEVYDFATEIAESLPLPLGLSSRLVQPNPGSRRYLDLQPGYRLRIVSPITKGEGPRILMDQDANLKPSGNNSFELELKASPSYVGVEESVYRVYREPGQNSEEIRLVSARSKIEGKWEETATSKFDSFSFDPGINKFRLFYLNWDGTETQKSILLGAHNEIAMEKATHQIMQNQASCSSMSIGVQCFVLPQGVALNPLISVLVNQQEKLVPVGLTLRMLIQDEIRQPLTTVLSTLTVRKKFRNQLTDISFPKGSMEILKLPLQGGEQIRW